MLPFAVVNVVSFSGFADFAKILMSKGGGVLRIENETLHESVGILSLLTPVIFRLTISK